MSTSLAIAQDWARAFSPPPKLSVSEWAEQHRRLPETAAARGARWRNDWGPYLVAIMDAPLERGVKQIAVEKCAQAGISEALMNIIGYHVEHRPCAMLLVQPTAGQAKDFSKDRLADAIRSTPSLRGIITDQRVPSDDGLPESTQTMKMFPGGFLALAGGNSPNSVARWSVRIAMMDDADRLPRFVGAEGDPVQLLANRTTSFHDGFTIFVSTPVLAGGRIDTLFGQGDQRRFHLPCVACGKWDWVAWKDETHWRVAFTDRKPDTARLVCPCGHEVREPERMELVRQGEWRPTAKPIAPGFVSFHLPAMVSPFVTLSGLVTKFLAAHMSGTPRKLREFVTTQLAEGWKDESQSLEPNELLARMEDF